MEVEIVADLDKKLEEILESMGESYYPTHEYNDQYSDENKSEREQALNEIKQAFKDAGYRNLGPHSGYECHIDCRFKHGVMTGQEWLSKALHAIRKYQQDRDYFRDNKHFRASTITMDELEMLLQRASGIEVES